MPQELIDAIVFCSNTMHGYNTPASKKATLSRLASNLNLMTGKHLGELQKIKKGEC
jgi:hypothetical protein